MLLKTGRPVWPALLVLLSLYFVGLTRPALLDPDEPVYANVAREMTTTGDWWTPHRNGELWFDKPPLFHWAVAASQSLLGATEAACRLPSALCACLLTGIVYVFGRAFLCQSAGLYAAAAIATCLQTILLGRAAVTDSLFVLCFAGSCGALFAGLQGTLKGLRKTSDRWLLLSGASLGLATLTKGPVAPLLVGAIAVLFALWERRPGWIVSRAALLPAGACLLVAGPWYASMLARHPEEFTRQFLMTHNLVRFAHSEHPSLMTPLLYYCPVLLAGLFPWSPFLFPALRGAAQAPVGRFLLIWGAVVFGFFSLSQTKLVTYIFPMYPAAALLVGRFLAGIEVSRDNCRALRWSVGGVVLLASVLAAILVWLAVAKYRPVLPVAGLLALLLVGGSTAGAWLARTKPWTPAAGSRLIGVFAAMMALLAPILFAGAGPVVEQRESTRKLAIWAKRHGDPPVLGFRVTAPSFEFYAGHGIAWERLPNQLRRRVAAEPNLMILTDEREVALANQALAPRRLVPQAWAGRRLVARVAGIERAFQGE